MPARVSAYASLVLGIWGALATLSIWGAGAGVVLGILALICGFAALTERLERRTRRVALIGVATGALAVIVFLIWLLLAALGV